jgi:hypothetical protein
MCSSIDPPSPPSPSLSIRFCSKDKALTALVPSFFAAPFSFSSDLLASATCRMCKNARTKQPPAHFLACTVLAIIVQPSHMYKTASQQNGEKEHNHVFQQEILVSDTNPIRSFFLCGNSPNQEHHHRMRNSSSLSQILSYNNFFGRK